jgi:hypothetical protein
VEKYRSAKVVWSWRFDRSQTWGLQGYKDTLGDLRSILILGLSLRPDSEVTIIDSPEHREGRDHLVDFVERCTAAKGLLGKLVPVPVKTVEDSRVASSRIGRRIREFFEPGSY